MLHSRHALSSLCAIERKPIILPSESRTSAIWREFFPLDAPVEFDDSGRFNRTAFAGKVNEDAIASIDRLNHEPDLLGPDHFRTSRSHSVHDAAYERPAR